MKKRISFIMAVIMIMSVMVTAIPVSVFAEAGAAPVEPELTTSTTNTYRNTDNPIVISTAADYKAFYSDLIAGSSNVINKKVTLAYDIVLNEDTTGDWYNESTVNPLYKVGANQGTSWGSFKGEFDGQGHTIKGVYLNGSYMGAKAVALFPMTDTGANIHSFTLDGFYMNVDMWTLTSKAADSFAAIGAITGRSTGGLTLNGITIRNGVIKASNVTAPSSNGGGINVGTLIGVFRTTANATVNLTNITVDDTVAVVGTGKTTDYLGGIMGAYNFGANGPFTLTFDLSGSSINPSGAINAPNAIGKITGTLASTRTDTYSVAYTGQTTQTGTADDGPDDANQIYDDLFAKLNAAFKTVGAYADLDTYAYNAEGSEMTITTVSDYQRFFQDITLTAAKNFTGKTVKLARDIVFNATNADDWADSASVKLYQPENMTSSWTGRGFNGTFDGQNHTLTGVYIKDSYSFYKTAGLFPATTDATIKNFTLDGFYVFNNFARGGNSNNAYTIGKTGTGALIGTAYSSIAIDRVTIKNGTVTSHSDSSSQDTNFGGHLSMGAVIGGYYYDSATTGRNIAITNTTVESNVVLLPGSNAPAVRGSMIGEYWFNGENTLSGTTVFTLSGSSILPRDVDTLSPIGGFRARDSKFLTRTGDAYQVINTTKSYDVSATYTALADLNETLNQSRAFGTVNTYESTKNKDVVEITTIADYKAFFADIVLKTNKVDFSGKTVQLQNDIVFNDTSDANWIANATNKLEATADTAGAWDSDSQGFNGTFDGNGKTLKGVYVHAYYSSHKSSGLFPMTRNATIQGLTIDGIYVSNALVASTFNNGVGAGSGTAALVGSAIGHITINGVTVKNATVTTDNNNGNFSGTNYLAPLIGAHTYLKNPDVTDDKGNQKYFTGHVTITNTKVSNVTLEAGTGVTAVYGGIVGMEDFSYGYGYDNGRPQYNFTGSDIQIMADYEPIGLVQTGGTWMTHSHTVINKAGETTTTAAAVSGDMHTPLNATIESSGAYLAGPVRYLGSQIKNVEGNIGDGIRFVAAIDCNGEIADNIKGLGFDLTLNYPEKNEVTTNLVVTKVYETVDNATKPEGFEYFFTFAIVTDAEYTTIPGDTQFTVSAYMIDASGAKITTATYTFTYEQAVAAVAASN